MNSFAQDKDYSRSSENQGERYLASGRQYSNALLGVRHQEEEGHPVISRNCLIQFYLENGC